MAIKFTETTKWNDSWFLDLPADTKTVFWYLCDKCNLAGFIDRHDRTIASAVKITETRIIECWKELEKSIVIIDGLIWVKNHLKHQKNLPLNPKSNCHKAIIDQLLEKKEVFGSYYKQVLFLGVKELEKLRGSEGVRKGFPTPTSISISNSISKSKGISRGKKPEERRYDPKVCDLVHQTAQNLKAEKKEKTERG